MITTMKICAMKLSTVPAIICLLLAYVSTSYTPSFAQDDLTPQQVLWNETQELLQRREYALAMNLLENGLDDTELFNQTKRVQEDLDAIKLLKKFSDTVEYSVEKLPPSKPLKVLSNDYRFKRRIEGSSGKIILLTDAQGDDVTYPLNRLDSATWLQIAEPELENWPDKDFVTGLFLAFDRYPDARVARTKLNAAADTGRNVTVWIKRLEEAEQQRKDKSRPGNNDPSSKDLIVGKWSVGIKDGPKLVWEFQRGGGGRVIEAGGRRRSIPAKWEQESTGVFRMTGAFGRTAVIHVAGDRIFGTISDGKVFRGIRQAD